MIHAPFRLPNTNLVYLDSVDSTMAVALRLMDRWAAGEPGELLDTVLVAGRQTEGRGRGSHEWVSPRGGFYLTWLGWVEGPQLRWVPLAAGVTAATAVEGVVPHVSVGIKWPNDLVARGGKLGGILCQARGVGERHWVAVGIGINVAEVPALASGAVLPPQSLQVLAPDLDPEAVLHRLTGLVAGGFRRRLEDSESTRREWVHRSIHRPGELVRLRDGRELISGSFAGFTSDGQLVLKVGGTEHVFAAGELIQDMSGEGGGDGAAGS